MAHALALNPAQETKWTVISGAMAGTVRLMGAGGFSIGRSPENEFVIVNDPKCSRKHATVSWTARGCEIVALNEANPVCVNGEECSRALLKDNDVVTLGGTEVQFNMTASAAETPAFSNSTELAIVNPTIPLPAAPAHSRSPAPARPRSSSSRKKNKSNPNRLVIYAVLGIVVLFFATATPRKKKNELALRNEQKIQADIDEANKLEEKANQMPIKRLDDSPMLRQAQENFVRGFRDYRKGQYERSLDSFQACLVLDPNHQLCTRYLRLAQRKFSELVQYDIILGRKYRDQNQFRACRASFKNVMTMVKDANSSPYKEAKANYDACNSMVEGRF
jgi:hypothetical protein